MRYVDENAKKIERENVEIRIEYASGHVKRLYDENDENEIIELRELQTRLIFSALTNTIPARCEAIIDPSENLQSLCKSYFSSMYIGWMVFLTYLVSTLFSWKIYRNRSEIVKNEYYTTNHQLEPLH
ncbi:11371_t:CDS:2 [Acaulospora colombiana]|uniref:11371_t:CDS:1 n=1 Tax=Acaulospora colombiana TaxID=27376 RepID=A0ACA9LC76_9GLOM|nr:11371_t:CDS:2 [Acaulospora colombiana]